MKRMVCVLLALIMLLGVMPASVSAAGISVSENAITVLKNLQSSVLIFPVMYVTLVPIENG